MSTSITICLVIFALMIIGFIAGKTPMPLTALTAMLLLVITGCLDTSSMLSCIGNTTVITIASMFVIAAGLNRTQVVKKVSGLVQKISGDSFSKGLLCYCIVTAMLAQVLPSAILVFSIAYPLVIGFCKRMSVSPSKAIFSVALVATCTVSIVPFGTGATFYINANTLMETYGITGYSMGMFDTMKAKLPMMIVVILYAGLLAPRFAPDKGEVVTTQKGRTMAEQTPLDPVHEVLGYGIFAVVILGLIFNQYLPLASWQICMIGALVTVLSGVLSEQEALASLRWQVIFLYIGNLAMGKALVATGAGDLIGDALASLLGNNPSNYVIGLAFYLVPFIATQFMSNLSTTTALEPIVFMTCASMGINPIGPFILNGAGALTALWTPAAAPTVPLMMGIGGYDQRDLIKMCWLPTIIICVMSVGWTMTIFPA